MSSTATSRPSKWPLGLPRKIKIAAYTYKVKVSDKALALACEGRPAVAAGSVSSQVIILSENNGPDFTADSLLHEVLHQCAFLGNNNLPDDEEFVCAVVGPLLQVIRENPGLIAFLQNPSAT